MAREINLTDISDHFEKKVSEGFQEGTKQRVSLETHIKQLSELNQQLSEPNSARI